MTQLRCRHCGSNLKASAEHAGKRCICPKCRKRVAVPGSGSASDEDILAVLGQPRPDVMDTAGAAGPPVADVIVCSCVGCHTRYVLGVNAVVTTFEQTLERLGQAAGREVFWAEGSSEVCDIVGLKPGQRSWPDDQIPPPATDPIAPAVLESRRRRTARRWQCAACGAEHPYVWPPDADGVSGQAGRGGPVESPSTASPVPAVTDRGLACEPSGDRGGALIDREIAHKYGVLPLAVVDQVMKVAIPDVGDDYTQELVDMLEFIIGRPVEPTIVPGQHLWEALRRCCSGLSASARLAGIPWANLSDSDMESFGEMQGVAEGKSASAADRLLRMLVGLAAANCASEILLRPARDAMQAFLRMGGSPCPCEIAPPPELLRASIIEYLWLNSDRAGRIGLSIGAKSLSLFVVFRRTLHGDAAILRFAELETAAAPCAAAETGHEAERGGSPETASSLPPTYGRRFCPECGDPLLAKQRSCPRCNTAEHAWRWRLTKCNACGKRLGAGMIVCPHCGADHAASRRLWRGYSASVRSKELATTPPGQTAPYGQYASAGSTAENGEKLSSRQSGSPLAPTSQTNDEELPQEDDAELNGHRLCQLTAGLLVGVASLTIIGLFAAFGGILNLVGGMLWAIGLTMALAVPGLIFMGVCRLLGEPMELGPAILVIIKSNMACFFLTLGLAVVDLRAACLLSWPIFAVACAVQLDVSLSKGILIAIVYVSLTVPLGMLLIYSGALLGCI